MRLVHDGLLAYGWPAQPTRGKCHVRVFEGDGEVPVVIVGQLEGDRGPSVVNAVEAVADRVRERFFSDGRDFRFFDYRIKGGTVGLDGEPEHYSQVELGWSGEAHEGPAWVARLDRLGMEAIVGCELPSFIEGRYRAA